jgi:hypothetical protein
VRVIALYKNNKKLDKKEKIHGVHDETTIYQEGKVTKPDSFDPDFRVECSHGIHFFITRQEAEDYS